MKWLRHRLPLVVGGSVGAALAALVIGTGLWPPSSQAMPLRLPPLPLRDNKQHLSGAEMATLLRWARRYRGCAVRHGLRLDRPASGADEIVITGRDRSKIAARQLGRSLLPCDTEVGEPPPASALVLTAEGWLHLYRPRTCRLPLVRSAQQ